MLNEAETCTLLGRQAHVGSSCLDTPSPREGRHTPRPGASSEPLHLCRCRSLICTYKTQVERAPDRGKCVDGVQRQLQKTPRKTPKRRHSDGYKENISTAE